MNQAMDSMSWTCEQTGRWRMPAEFEPQERVWLTLPDNESTWPGCLDEAQQQHEYWRSELSKVVEVVTVQSLGLRPEDAWVRDYGPIFVTDTSGGESGGESGGGALAMHDFVFNSWGGKYPPWEQMNRTPGSVQSWLHEQYGMNIPRFKHDFVLEGGSFEVNGKGTLLTTEQCLLHPNRNPQLDREQIERKLCEWFGVSNVLWMPGGIEGDDTDGHQDDLARWLSPDTIAAVRAPKNHPDHAILEANWRVLSEARDQDERKLNLVALPIVEPVLTYDFPTDYWPDDRPVTEEDRTCPASYANWLISNGHLFLPVFNRPSDEIAIRAIEQAAPQLAVVPIRAEWLIVGRGSLHCLSQQQPASSR
jgi:agmatine deiminase